MITKRNIFISVSNMRNTVMYDGAPNLHSDNFGAQVTHMILTSRQYVNFMIMIRLHSSDKINAFDILLYNCFKDKVI